MFRKLYLKDLRYIDSACSSCLPASYFGTCFFINLCKSMNRIVMCQPDVQTKTLYNDTIVGQKKIGWKHFRNFNNVLDNEHVTYNKESFPNCLCNVRLCIFEIFLRYITESCSISSRDAPIAILYLFISSCKNMISWRTILSKEWHSYLPLY